MLLLFLLVQMYIIVMVIFCISTENIHSTKHKYSRGISSTFTFHLTTNKKRTIRKNTTYQSNFSYNIVIELLSVHLDHSKIFIGIVKATFFPVKVKKAQWLSHTSGVTSRCLASVLLRAQGSGEPGSPAVWWWVYRVDDCLFSVVCSVACRMRDVYLFYASWGGVI